MPYWLGRLYLGHPKALREFSGALTMAALVYAPLCLWEVRMSPNLHRFVYGFHPMDFLQAVRFGGFRPNVFLSHGLMLGMIMASATLVAYWEWRTRARVALLGLPFGWVVVALAVTTLLTKATGSILLLAAGIAVLEGTRWLRTPWLVVGLLLVPPAYSAARIAGWTGHDLVSLSRTLIAPERAESLLFRLDQEDALIERAMQNPVLGWGGWGRSRIFDEDGRDISVTDGMWIITLGVSGLVGLVALGLMLALPVLALLRRFPARLWGDPRIAPLVAMAVMVLLWAADNLLNAMVTPLAPAMAGAVGSFALLPRGVRRRRMRVVPAGHAIAQRRGPSSA
jgi:O-antigen ligase